MQNEEPTTLQDSLKLKGFKVKTWHAAEVSKSSGEVKPVTTVDGFISRAISSGTSIEEIQALINMRNDEIKRIARLQFREALARFQEMVPPITRNKHVEYEHRDRPGKTEYEYATLGFTKRSIMKAAGECGFSHDWKTRYGKGEDGKMLVFISCILSHIGGHSESDEMCAPIDDAGGKRPVVQQMKSTVSYLRRGTLESVYGLVNEDEGEDDDGRSAYQEPIITQIKKIDVRKDPERFKGILKSVINGSVTIDEVQDTYNLSDDQFKALQTAKKS